jgi:ArsR family transcriptional regulator, lead/cadmium/zinc/bismuth-responsive transcriptional repressor
MSLEPIHKKSIASADKAIPSEELLKVVTEVFQTLSDLTRLKIIYALKKQELCVRDIAVLIGISESGVSHQLSHLRKAKLVKTRRNGNIMYYSLSYNHLGAMLKEAEYYADHIKQSLLDHPYNT